MQRSSLLGLARNVLPARNKRMPNSHGSRNAAAERSITSRERGEISMSDAPVVETQLHVEEVFEVTLSPNWTGKLIEALAKAQLKFKPVLKQTDNAAFVRGGVVSKYADLAQYIDSTQG